VGGGEEVGSEQQRQGVCVRRTILNTDSAPS
jgi:hypothetical protein